VKLSALRISPARRRSLIIALIVGSAVSLGHALVPGASWWPIAHTALPITVFFYGAWAAGHRRVTAALLIRGALTVAFVSLAFSAINDRFDIAVWARVALNYVVPFIVSSLGAASASQPSADRPRS
jgi:hypothetical protein